jgi:hypothetical protein
MHEKRTMKHRTYRILCECTITGTSEHVSEPNLKSKLFSSALGPSTLKPYYYKAQHLVHQKDITLSTLVTRNRFPVLGRLASHYKGKKARKKRKEKRFSFSDVKSDSELRISFPTPLLKQDQLVPQSISTTMLRRTK